MASWWKLGGIRVASIVGLIACAILTVQAWILSRHDSYGCRSVLETGAWTAASVGSDGTLQSDHQWQPHGCRMAYYKANEMNECLSGRKIVFVGDSTMRQIFWAAAAYLNPNEAYQRMAVAEKHSDQLLHAGDVTLQYIWDTWISGSKLQTELELFGEADHAVTEHTTGHLDDTAALLLVGTPAMWAAAFTGGEHVKIFKQAMKTMNNAINETLEQSIGGKDGSSSDQILVVPVLYPRYEGLNEERARSITPEKLEHMNSLLGTSSPEISSRVFWSYNMLAHGLNGSHDAMGVHMNALIALNQFHMALNIRCNNRFAQYTPPKGTCCVKPPAPTKYQNMFGAALPVLVFARLAASGLTTLHPAERAVCYLVFILGWSWMTDRSGAFTSIERHFGSWVFPFLTLFWIMGSFVGGTSTTTSAKNDLAVAEFLPREQSDELKGLMQGVILIYHYTYSSKVLPVYKIIRVFISTYIFLSAYGQSMIILHDIRRQKPGETNVPASLTVRHAVAVLFRLNLLCVLLPFAMVTTNYASYYFAPCVSFWFITTWLTLRIGFRANLSPSALGAKVILTLALSHLFIMTPGVLEYLSRACEWHPSLSWSAREMRFRLSLDSMAPFAGILFAAWNSCQTPKSEPPCPSHGKSNGHWTRTTCTTHVVPVWIITSSLLAVALYAVTLVLSSPAGLGQSFDKYTYNAVHPYVFPFVAIALITLRNATPGLRSGYMRLPAWLGRISLETYVLQYHVWLANDATSLLSFGLVDRYNGLLSDFAISRSWIRPVARGFEACMLTICFLTLAKLAHWSTRVLGQAVFRSRSEHSGLKGDDARTRKEA